MIRGQKYRFINNSGGSHPFQIRSAIGGSAYSTGVTNNGGASGNIDFAVPYDAPANLFYQCTSHGGMVGNLYIHGAGGLIMNVGVTTFSGSITASGDISSSGTIIGSNLSGTNTGDQDLSTYIQNSQKHINKISKYERWIDILGPLVC